MAGRGIATFLGALVAGLATAAVTAVLVSTVYEWTGINVFTFTLWLVVPAGALLVGATAASGYGLAALALHARPRWYWAVQMIVIAGAAQALIYYLEYTHLTLSDGRRVATLVDFPTYLDVTLTHAVYRVGRAQARTPELGSAGYWIAGIQFVGALVGGLGVHLALWSWDTCAKCSAYLRTVATQRKVFHDADQLARYYDKLFKLPVDGPQFAEVVRTFPTKAKPGIGSVQLVSKLRRCPRCGGQFVHEQAEVMGKTDWRAIPQFTRRTAIPAGVDVSGPYLAEPRYL